MAKLITHLDLLMEACIFILSYWLLFFVLLPFEQLWLLSSDSFVWTSVLSFSYFHCVRCIFFFHYLSFALKICFPMVKNNFTEAWNYIEYEFVLK